VEYPDYQGYGAFLQHSYPMVVRLHHLPKRWSDPAQARQSAFTRWFEDRALNRADLVIAVSHWAKDVALKTHPRLKNVVVNYYTVNDLFLQTPDETIERENNLVIFAGTLARHKGIWELARAWERVKMQFPQARLVMIGKDFLQLARSIRPAMVLLDVLMPSTNGYELLRELKSGEDGEKQRVVMLSVVDDKKTAAALGADGYILKPLDRGNLRALLERINLRPNAQDVRERTDAAA
jgi:CheY-like chemotaxis protein